MQIKRIIPLVLALVIFVCGCSKTANLELIKTAADITHDGAKDGIVTYIEEADAGKAFVMLYTKLEDKWVPIYQTFAGTKEADYKGIYICKKNGDYCIFEWKPSFDEENDTTTLKYSIYYLQYDITEEKGNAISVEEDSITFTNDEVEKTGNKYDAASAFVKKLNSYIEKSAALLDTVGGKLIYSPDTKNPVRKQYTPKWYDKDYEPTTTQNVSSRATVSSEPDTLENE